MVADVIHTPAVAVESEFPQGSVIGPLMFFIFIK